MKHISETLQGKEYDKYRLSAERIVILDYSEGKVYIRFVPMSMIEQDGDEIFDYFTEKLELRADNCYFMIVNDDDFIDDNTKNNG